MLTTMKLFCKKKYLTHGFVLEKIMKMFSSIFRFLFNSVDNKVK